MAKILLFLFIFSFYSDIFSMEIKSSTNLAIQRNAAMGVIGRLLPGRAESLFDLHLESDLPRNTYRLLKRENESLVIVIASSGVAATRGIYHYLRHFCNSQVSWEGNQISLPDPLPAVDLQVTAPSHVIYLQNVCTWSYSYTWWTIKEWRRHIDWMALHGITLALAPIQEAIWAQVYRDIGLTDEEIDEHLAGPAFLAWNRMGNMRGWGGQLSVEYMTNSFELQRTMIQMLRELGIAVAVPSFAGHVPRAISRLFPNATTIPVGEWSHFTGNYCCPLFLDPIDPLFAVIGEKFLDATVEAFGTDHLYFADPYNENKPNEANPEYIRSVSTAIYDIMHQQDDKAVWLFQGWLFSNDQSFWTPELAEAFLTGPPKGSMLILDLKSETFPQFERLDSYYGQPFIWCMLHNFGGNLGMQGSVSSIHYNLTKTRNDPNFTMIGVGLTMEGINQNHVIYEFVLEMAWSNDSELYEPETWFENYSISRYGALYPKALEAWKLLLNSAYDYNGPVSLHGQYLLTRPPSLSLSDKTFIWYDPDDLYKALKLLLEVHDDLGKPPNDLFLYDVVDLTRQLLQVKSDSVYLNILRAYEELEKIQFSHFSEEFLQVLRDMDRILRTNEHFLLGQWIESAKNLTENEQERQLLEFNARNQITLWGPNGEISDYAAKQWSGLVLDYYEKRWEYFFVEAERSLILNRCFDEDRTRKEIFDQIEWPFNNVRNVYPTSPEGDTIEIAKEILERHFSTKTWFVVERSQGKPVYVGSTP